MKRVLIDTNIVVDLLAQREPFYKDSSRIFSLSESTKIELFISSLTFANINYILLKMTSGKFAKEILRRFKPLTKILPLNEQIVEYSLNDENFQHFEDGLQYYTALENDLSVIVTRDLKGFKNSNLQIMSPEEFINSVRI